MAFVNIMILVPLLALAGSVQAAGSGGSCEEMIQAAERARAQDDSDALKEIFHRMERAGLCPAAVRGRIGRLVAVALVRSVQREVAGRDSLSAADVAMLEDSLEYARVWQALAMLGDYHWQRKEYPRAALRYQASLQAIDDPVMTPEEPDAAHIERIFRRAERARLLAPDHVKALNSRSGEPSGLARGRIRSFTVERVALPVTFEFDTTRMTGKGRAAAVEMLDFLRAEGEPDIRLIGHADPVGTEDYNRNLSLDRARALRRYLMDNGYRGRIEVSGLGESRPPRLDNPDFYTRAERHQLARRVELER